MKKQTIAVLDKQNRLVGYKQLAKPAKDAVVVPDGCDLPVNGTYKWDADKQQFLPLGFGFGPVGARPPVTDSRVLYMLVRATAGMPEDAYKWAAWYEKHILPRDAERDERVQITIREAGQ